MRINGPVQDDSTPEAKIKEIIENGATQIILTGAPGTGKTRLAKKIAESFCQEQTKKYELVQFIHLMTIQILSKAFDR